MSESQSRLAVIIDSTGAQKNAESLTTALDKMTQSGDKAVTGMLKVTKASDEEKAALEKLKAAIDPIGAAINTVGRRFTELQKYFDKGLIDEEEFRTLSRLLHETTEELSGVAQAQRDAEKAGKDAAAQLEVQSRALQVTLDKVDPLAAALRNLEQQQKDLSTALSQGKINTSQYDTYTKKLQETRREVTGEAQAERDAIKAREEQVSSLRRLEAQIDPVGEAFRRLAEQQRQLDSAKSSGMLSPLAYDRLNSKLAESRDALEKTSTQFGKTGMSAAATANAMRMVPAQMTDIIVSLQGGQAPLTVLLQQGGQLKDMFGGIVPAAKAMGTYVAGLVNPFTLAAGAVGLLTYAVYSNRQELDAASKLAKSSLGATGDYAEQLAMNILAISDNTGKAVDEVASMFITTNDGASEAINKLIDVGYGYDDARKMVESYKGSANFTALNKDIDEHQRKILKIGDAWTAAAIDVKNYYTGAQFGKQDVALGGAIDPSMRFIGQAVDLQNTMNELRIQGNKEVAASVDWITKEYLATDRVAGAEDRLKQAREQARKIAASGNQEAITQANNLIALREKEVEQAKKAQEPKQKKEKAYTEDAATRLLDQINQQTASLMDQLQTTDKLSAATKQRIKFEQQIADIKTKSQLTADQKSLLANADAIEAALRRQEIIQSQVTTLDDYRKMQEQVKQKDVQTNDLLIERLKLLDKAKAAGATDTDATRANVLRATKASLPSSVTSVTGGLTPKNGELSGSWGGLVQQSQQLDQAQQALDQWQQQQLQSYQAYYQNRADLTNEYEQQIANVRQQYAQQSQSLSAQQYLIQTTAIQSTMDSLVSITRDGFGEQSAIYKVAFAANKAYAIAQSLVSIQQGIAMAAANPFPANLVAMASVAAASASIVSNIASVSANGFEKGGYTGGMGTKSVAGVVHGQEYVFDAAATRRIGVSNLEAIRNGNLDATLSKPGFGTGNNEVSATGGNTQTNHISQVINMPRNSGMTQQEMDSVLKRNNKQLVTELSNQTLEGKGQFGKSLRAAQGRGNRMT